MAIDAGDSLCAQFSKRRSLIAAAMVVAIVPADAADNAVPARKPAIICEADSCLVASDRAFPSLIVGELIRIEDRDAARRWWTRARASGAWIQLPSDSEEFAQLVRAVRIRTVDRRGDSQASRTLTVLMTQYELDGEAFRAGALVRYAPHGIDHEEPPAEVPRLQAYWGLTGCVLTLCRADDAACKTSFLPGIYERRSGRPADWRTGMPTASESLIEPVSRRPVKLPAPASGVP